MHLFIKSIAIRAAALVVLLVNGWGLGLAANTAKGANPNIVLILVDDMGYGDPRCFNPKSRLKTPAIDRLAREGLMFRDAHAPQATCVGSRYGLFTGRYPVRDYFRYIKPGRLTLAQLLKRNGYRTGMIGKWHLGFDAWKGEEPVPERFPGGPVDRGFDTFFGMWSSLDWPPYFFTENRNAVNTITAPPQSIAV